MAQVEPKDLILQLQAHKSEDYRIIEQEKMISNFSEASIKEKFSDLLAPHDKYTNNLEMKGIYFAKLGALYAFLDRELDPLEDTHFVLFGQIEKDIQIVYKELSENLKDEKIWIFECFDYGIKHVYYLDWTLYLSKSCY
jgi:hypothetical protein